MSHGDVHFLLKCQWNKKEEESLEEKERGREERDRKEGREEREIN